jgi:hypothetical protein
MRHYAGRAAASIPLTVNSQSHLRLSLLGGVTGRS